MNSSNDLSWNLVEPDYNVPYMIIVFDDKNKMCEELENTWFLCGARKGKVRMIHKDRTTIIESISKWKVIEKLFVSPCTK